MRTFVTGDTHGGEEYGISRFTSRHFAEGRYLTKQDYVIIAGDFGFIWDPSTNISNKEKYFLKWMSAKPWTTLFIDGNHENHTRLDELEIVEMFGAPVGKVNDSIYHLKRGYIYTINGKKIFTFGGARSADKYKRMPDVSWWAREEPNYSEMMRGFNTLKEAGEVDYIIAHECPTSVMDVIVSHHNERYQFSDMLQMFVDNTKFKHYYFGHHHQNNEFFGKFTCLYDKIVEI